MTLEALMQQWREDAAHELSRVRTDAPERAPVHLASAQVLKKCARDLEVALNQLDIFGGSGDSQ